MPEIQQEVNRSLREELLKISDLIQMLSIKYRDRGIEHNYAIKLNDLQIKVGELIGTLWFEKSSRLKKTHENPTK